MSCIKYGSQNNIVGIMTAYHSSKRFFCSPKWLWCPCSLLFSVYHHFVLLEWGRGWKGWSMVLTTYHHLVPSLRISGYIPLLFLCALMVWTGQLYCLTLPIQCMCLSHVDTLYLHPIHLVGTQFYLN